MSYVNLVKKISNRLSSNIKMTPLEFNERLSTIYNCNIFYKREDLQITRSFKIRGAMNKMQNLLNKKPLNFICASAGNHAQGFSYTCNKLDKKGVVYVPEITPLQKINRIKYFGKDNIRIKLYGENFQECLLEAERESSKTNSCFIHPFNDYDIINGQATVAQEIYKKISPDFIIIPIGGGGLISGIAKYSKEIHPDCKIIGVEPLNAESMSIALKNNKPMNLHNIDTFVDGASVSIVGDKTFDYCKKYMDDTIIINKKHLCHEIMNTYQDDGIILEPAGALSISALKNLSCNYNLEGKKIVCLLSGGNNDLSRYNEISQYNSEYLGLRHYFIVEFNQKPGQLKIFINYILENDADIIRFEYIKKTNKNFGNVLIGIDLIESAHIDNIVERFHRYKFKFKKIEFNDLYYDFLI